MLQLFQTRDGPFFHRHTCLHLSHFFAVSSKHIYPIYCFGHSSAQSVLQWNSFSPLNTLSTNVTVVSDQRWANFFHRHTCVHLSHFFRCIIGKYLSHIFICAQLVSVCFAMKLFLSFRIHCLQILDLFQTRDGPIFFIITLVYTCRAFFAESSETICPIYSLVHSSFQSVSQWNFFSPLKYIVHKCYYCFSQRMGHFFRLLQRWT